MSPEKKILIIDDDPRNIFALSAVLRTKGFEAVAAQSATEGLAILHANKGIKVVLLDIMMPELDGYATLEAIRGDPALSGLAIIAVTAQAMAGDEQKAMDAGADAYVAKPVDVDRLLELLNQFGTKEL